MTHSLLAALVARPHVHLGHGHTSSPGRLVATALVVAVVVLVAKRRRR